MLRSRYRYFEKLRSSFAQHFGAFAYRFGHAFAMDAIMTSRSTHPLAVYRAEILSIFDEFSRRIEADKQIPLWRRIFIRAFAIYMQTLPIPSGRLAMRVSRFLLS
jgi:hypothetical protein